MRKKINYNLFDFDSQYCTLTCTITFINAPVWMLHTQQCYKIQSKTEPGSKCLTNEPWILNQEIQERCLPRVLQLFE